MAIEARWRRRKQEIEKVMVMLSFGCGDELGGDDVGVEMMKAERGDGEIGSGGRVVGGGMGGGEW